MSYSSLWVMDKEYMGSELCEFENSWFFTPMVLDVLFEKYLPHKRRTLGNGEFCGYISSVAIDRDLGRQMNEAINHSECMEDRICWEMANQQVFFVKDKKCVTEGVRNFIKTNAAYQKGLLEKTHIKERFKEVAAAIEELDEAVDMCFVFKNTSCDDGVEYWFDKYNAEEDDFVTAPLSELGKYATEFVVIENRKIVRFVDNVTYFAANN